MPTSDPEAAAKGLLNAMHLIYSQSLGPDWTAAEAVAFMRKTAREAIRNAEALLTPKASPPICSRCGKPYEPVQCGC